MRTSRRILVLMLCIAAPPALADGELASRLTAADKARLADYEATRAAAIAEARASGSADAVAVLDKVLSGQSHSLRGSFDPIGGWTCRTLKLGGLLPLTVYPPFKCRIVEAAIGWRLEKLTGLQRTSGHFYDDGEMRLVYLGAAHYSDETPKTYGTEPERDQVGYVIRPADTRLRLEFPAPRFESKFDILDLSR